MKLKNILIVSLMVILMTSIGYACVFLHPTSGEIFKGTKNVINVSTCTSLSEAVNCSVSASSAKTGDSIAAFLLYNQSAPTAFNATKSVSGELDSNDWIWTGTCYNITNNAAETITSVTAVIDQTKPQVSNTAPTDGTSYSVAKDLVLNASCVNASSAIVYIDGNQGQTMTESSDVCTYELGYLGAGDHTWYVIASDGTNETTSTSTNINVRRTTGVTGLTEETTTSTGGGSSNTTAIIIVAAVAAYLFWGKGGKKRR